MLEREGAVDLDQRQAEWRTAGWRGSASEEQAAAASVTGQTQSEGSGSMAQTEDSESIPVVEERLRVGKREVNRGTVRVHSHVVEEPVQENVHLRQERVEVERERVEEPTRPVAAGSPGDLLREKTVEVTETAEEPVVSKEAVVKETVRVRKTADERLEQVDDTVRHTEVEIDDDRTGNIPSDETGNIPSKDKGRTPRQR
ncbi:MAG: YsnF/AvaK domain-containing protein [Steroidobacteraceae bacterium]|nr:YsnF/AvaK domain-containing protein [Steroidobacteraceae bacterium]